jgi:soluble lytic murein transglycosylase-like protein
VGGKSLALSALIISSSVAAEQALFQEVGRYCGVPSDILYAVALVESGRKINGTHAPWPWTLNIEGKAYYFDSREAMFQKVMAAIADKRTIDIGLMQTNWHWKYERLGSPWKATEPLYNVKTGCEILKRHFDNTGDWWIAVGKYHRESDAPRHAAAATKYSQRVKRAWETLQ